MTACGCCVMINRVMNMDKHAESLSPLIAALSDYTEGRSLPMHMPGHKRRGGGIFGPIYGLDITEIDGFDDLHRPRGILLRCQERAARLWGSGRCFFLVGGSTCGILAAVRAAARRGDTVIMARNCHRSVYHAVELCGLSPVYLFPETDAETGIAGSIAPEQVKKALAEHPGAGLVILTSPTYEGVISDVAGIANAAHAAGVPVLIDAAHGAHLGLSPYFPGGAVGAGADIVIMSLHKTLPALTQCALAHVSGGLVDPDRLARELSVFETSSPSYVLMSSIDLCVGTLESGGGALFADYSRALGEFYGQTEGLEKLKVLAPRGGAAHPAFFGFDRGKLVIGTRRAGLTGGELAEALRQRDQIEVEMAWTNYLVAMTSLCDTPDTLGRFAGALLEIDRELDGTAVLTAPVPDIRPEIRLGAGEAVLLEGENLPLWAARGRMALEYIWAYPPGIPVVVPGEILTAGVLEALRAMAGSGVAVTTSSGSGEVIRCTL